MKQKRTDKNGRVLQRGESQRKDGQYVYKYIGTDKKPKYIYSWRLTERDSLPKGKRPCKPLRELIQEVQRDKLDGIDTVGQKMTLCQLYEKHNNLRPNVRKGTVIGRRQLMDILKADKLGNTPICDIKPSDAKEWVKRMKERGYAFHTINNHKRSLLSAFYTAIEDDLVRKNPFNFKLTDIIQNDTVEKEALTEQQTKALLDFVKEDKVYKSHYDAMIVLLNTGLRISELCGLTLKDIDFKNGYIRVTHQLIHDTDGYHVTEPKTENSVRDIPMLKPVQEALKRVIESRDVIQPIKIDGYTNFIFLNTKGVPMYNILYGSIFRNVVKKYNKSHEVKLPQITPHTMRHTFCTNMANKKMSPNTLQYIMGHKNITMTLGYYAHGSAESAKQEMKELEQLVA